MEPWRDRVGLSLAGALLEDLGHVCEPLRIDYDSEVFNASTVRLWAVTLGHYMNLFANSTGRTIGPDNTEAVTLAIYKFGQSLKALEMEQAMSQQNGITRRVLHTIREYDVLLTPGLVRDVAKLGEFDQNAKDLDILGWWNHIVQNYSAFTPLFNTTDQPAVMLPLWQAASGLPLAMQFVGRPADEETLYSLAGQLEQAAPWASRRPAHFA